MEEFLVKLQDMMDSEDELTMDTILTDIEEWDSLSFVGFMAMANAEYGKKISPKDLRKSETVRDLYNLIQ